ncbi:MAG TPA: NAD(P)/FAD-dependent oxidoreductase [Phycisphaerae bacterium]|nr:NAD(P)/FAD-dependent oxidoreductase [Phycisphaerae bacterium]
MASIDVAIIGGGAAGLATAIFAARHRSSLRVAVLDGAKKLGAKILVSGGGRCNVTNVHVTPEDYWGGSRHIVKRVLSALSVEETVAFFREIGVPLHEEEIGKLFPDSNSARTVLDALVREATRLGVSILCEHRVEEIRRNADGFDVLTGSGSILARCVVLATGGKSLPKTGSDGSGYAIAQSLGHSIVATTPGLAPLILDGDFHVALSGLTQDVEIVLRAEDEKPVRISGSMLWTHFGISGPAAMNASRVWHRARLEGREVTVTVNFVPGETTETMEKQLMEMANGQARTQLRNALSTIVPGRLAETILRTLKINPQTLMAHLSRDDRGRIARAMTDWPLPVRDSRGYGYAEVTAGGMPLTEIDSATMQSRKCPGLYLVGEILDVDGRIGGFNFQWAWASGFVAGRAAADSAAA